MVRPMPLRRLRVAVGAMVVTLLAWVPAIAAPPALPTGGKVTAGTAGIGQAGSTLTVSQSSARAIINWSSFNIGKGGTVQFNNGSGVTLNRVTGPGGSILAGQLNATGSVYLLNPAGIIVAPSGQVFVGGSFAASTLAMSDAAFLGGGAFTLSGSGGSVINQGTIQAAGGDILLAASSVANSGDLSASNGEVALIAGSTVAVDPGLDGRDRYTATAGASSDTIVNTGQISAAEVALRAHAGDIYALAVGTGGQIDATGVSEQDGSVYLISDQGKVTANGQITAAGPGPNAGLVETSGESVDFTGLKVVARNWLVDPTDLTVDAAAAATISSNLATTNVTLTTSATGATGPGNQTSGLGDINIDSGISWGSANTLTLNAYHSLNILAPIVVSGAGGLAITTNVAQTDGVLSFGLGPSGFAGSVSYTAAPFSGSPSSGPSLSINGVSYNLIYSMTQLANELSDAYSGEAFALATPLNASGVTYTGPVVSILNGPFNGLGNTISNLNINATNTFGDGLFGSVNPQGAISSLGVTGSVVGSTEVGLLAGYVIGSVFQSYSSGSVSGSTKVGGLIGLINTNTSGQTITNSYSTATITADEIGSGVGGLVGVTNGSVTNSYATGTVTGTGSTQAVGGLVGELLQNATISNSYAQGAVSVVSGYNVGGLVGETQSGSSISGSNASGNVSGGPLVSKVGGLVGINGGAITNSFATGAVTASNSDGGGLVGYNTGSIGASYATGAVSAPNGGSGFGGLVGDSAGTVSGSYATGSVSGTSQTVVTYLVGGLVGYLEQYATISNSYAQGAVSVVLGNGVGGLVGQTQNGSSISGSNASGNVSIGPTAYDDGGLVGANGGAITNSFATGAVTAGNSDGGGLVGDNFPSGMIAASYATGAVTAPNGGANFGGLVGESGGTISGSYATGPVSGTSQTTSTQSVGGLVGSNGGAISTSSAQGAVSIISGGSVGGLVGGASSSSSISGSNASGNISIGPTATTDGGLVGGNSGAITNSFATGAVTAGLSDGGGLVGANAAIGSISASYATGAVSAPNGGSSFGGLVGESRGAVSGSYATGAVSGTSQTVATYNVGGLVGFLDQGTTISNSYAQGAVSIVVGTGVGGLVGATVSGSTISGSNASGNVSIGPTATNAGGLVGDNAGAITNSFATGAVTAGLSDGGGLVGYNETTGSIGASYATGAVAAPTGGSNFGGLVGESAGAVSGSYATGAVSGSGYIGGLVGYTDSGSSISGSNASGNVIGGGGGLVGDNAGAITNSYATGTVGGGGGGLVGENEQSGSISMSYATGSVNGGSQSYDVGGLVGVNYGTISRSYASGQVSGGYQIGGLVGYNGGLIQSSYFTGAVSGSEAVGGLVGYEVENPSSTSVGSSPGISNSFYDMSTVLVNGAHVLGYGALYDGQYSDWFSHGMSLSVLNYFSNIDSQGYIVISSINDLKNALGFAEDPTVKFRLAGNLDVSSAPGLFIPYLAGTFDGQGFSILNTSANSGNAAGAVVGYLARTGLVENVGAMGGSVTSIYDAGGLVGVNNGTIQNSSANVSVTANNNVGGFVGYNIGTVTGSFSTGSVTLVGSSQNAGGFVGVNTGSISNAYSTGAVNNLSANSLASGGFVGENDGQISQAYATGYVAVGGAAQVQRGGFSGFNDGTLTSAYYDANTTGQALGAQSDGSVGLTTAALQGALPTGFDPTIWSTGAGLYPYLTALAPAKIISGYGFNANGTPALGGSVSVYEGGSTIGTAVTASTGANGYYYIFVPPSEVSATTAVGATLTLASAPSVSGASFTDTPSLNAAGNIQNLNITAGQLAISTVSPSLSALQSELGSTFGALAYAHLPAGLAGATWIIDASGPFTIDQAFSQTGPVQIQSGGAMTIAGAGSVASQASGDAVILAANGNVINNAGAGAITTPNGSFLIYSQVTGSNGALPTGDSFGGLSGSSWYGDAYNFGTGTFAATAGPGNRFVYGYQPTLTVTAATVSSTYNGLVQTDSYAVSGLVNGDSAQAALSGTPTGLTTSSKNVGAYALTPGGLTSGENYAIAYQAGTLTVTPAPLTITATAANKTYDGTTTASVTLADNHITGDQVTDSDASAAFADKNAGQAKTVTVSGLAISGPDAGDYTLVNTTTTALASITPAPLTITATAANKTYDGTTAASVTLADNHITGDQVTDSDASAAFADKNAGQGKTVTVSGLAISGPDAGDYTLVNTTTTAVASIAPAPLTITATAANKTYDGTTTASVTLADNHITGDQVTDSDASAAFANKNAGQGKTVTVSGLAISGPDAGDYTLVNTTTTAVASIAPAPLTITATAANKTYDGTTTASVTLADNHITGDQVTDSDASAAFSDKNAGQNKMVTVSGLAISGPDAANYTLVSATTTALASITPAPLTVAANPQTDVSGSTIPPLTYQLTAGSLISGDAFSGGLATTATSASPAGVYPITEGSLTAGQNYNLTYIGANLTVTASQAPIALTGIASLQSPPGQLTYGGLTNDPAAVMAASAAGGVDAAVAAGKSPVASPAVPTAVQFELTAEERKRRRSATSPITQTSNGDQVVGTTP